MGTANIIDFSRQTDHVAAYRAVIAALDAMGEGLVIIEDGCFTFVNDAMCRLTGYPRDELLGWPRFERLFAGDERERVLGNHRRRLAGEVLGTRYETRIEHRDGHAIDVEISVSTLRIDQRVAAVVAARDIRDRKRDEAALREHRDNLQQLVIERTAELAREKEWADATLASVADAVVSTDTEGRLTYLNGAAEQLTGLSLAAVRGRPAAEVLPLYDEPTGAALPFPDGRSNGLPAHVVLRNAGGDVPVEVTAAPIWHGNTPRGAVIVLHDVSEQRRLTQKLSYQASHDTLTGLVNRREFERRLRALVADAADSGREHALCYFDLDQFKVVNDTCGHSAGDELLRQLSSLLRQQIRQSDTLARLGGDEFGLLLPHCGAERAQIIARSLLDSLGRFRFCWGDKCFTIGASLGLVQVGPDSSDFGAVMRNADAACYEAKDRGRNRIHVYQPDDAELAQRQGEMQWVARLTRALEQDAFRLFYQSIVPLHPLAGQAHCEILLRLVDDDGRLVAPGAFIPAAERFGLMPRIDRWVVRHAIAAYAEISARDPFIELPVFSVNLSGTSLADPKLVDFIRNVLDHHAVAPDSLCFEITETAAIANLDLALKTISDLRRLGCAFALDDFGIGLSSFAYLKSLPVDYLKVDGNFVKDMLNDPVDQAMVEAIHRLGSVLGIKTIAEYVENGDILGRLATMGVDFGQGYGIAEPHPLSEFRI